MRKLLCFLALLGYSMIFNNYLFAYPNKLSAAENSKNNLRVESTNNLSNSSSKYKINQSRQFDFSNNKGIQNLGFSESQIALFETNQATEDDSSAYYSDKANQLLDLVKSENRFIDKLDSATIISLPVGIKAELGGLEYIILIDEVSFKPEGAYFNAILLYPKMSVAYRYNLEKV